MIDMTAPFKELIYNEVYTKDWHIRALKEAEQDFLSEMG